MTEPYYSDKLITLYHGDCLDFAEWLTADILVTDPPYGMAFQSGFRRDGLGPIINDDSTIVRDEALTLWGDKPAAVFGTWRAPRPKDTRQVLIWHKPAVGPGMGDLSQAFGTSHEDIYLLGKWERRTTRRGSVISTEHHPGTYTSKIGHPTPKPIGLMEILIESAPLGVIADPFAGSGSTLIAARNLGRKAIGVEIEERYAELIVNRLSQDCFDFGELA